MAANRTIRDVRIDAGGKRYTGSYEVNGKIVEVWSAYGSRAGVIKAGDAKATAERLMAGIVAGVSLPN